MIAVEDRGLAEPPTAPETALEAADVAARESYHYADLKGRQIAAQRLASETYHGTEEITWDDLFETPMTWLVQDLLPIGASAFLVAKPNTGKTFAYIDLALNMVLGRTWLGKATMPGRVLFVLGEGRSGFGARLRAWCDRNGVSPEEVKDHVAFIDGANVNHDQSLARLAETAERIKPDLIVFDTYAATSGVASEDDSAMTSVTLNRARTIYPPAALLFVSHPTKSSEDTDCPILRGSSALKGSVDLVLTMFPDRAFRPIDGTKGREYLALSTEHDHGGKNRNALTETIRGIYLDPEGDSMVVVQEQSGSTDDPLTMTDLFLKDGMTVAEFMKDAGLEGKHKTRVTDTYLRAHPDVVEVPGGGRNPARYYWKDSVDAV